MKKQYWVLLLAVVVVVVGATIIFTKKGPKINEPILKIGLAAPLTGAVSYQGERFVNGASLAMEEYNNTHSDKIELNVQDDKCNATEAASVANKLVNLDGLDKIISYCGAASPPYQTQLSKQDGILFIASVRLESDEGKNPFVINLLPSPEKEMTVLAEYIKEEGIDNVAVIYQQDFFGETYRNKFKTAFEQTGGKIVLEEGYDTNSATDFRTSFSKIKDSQAGGIVNFIAHAGNYSVILKQAKEMGLDLPFFSEWITENPALIDTAGDLAEGIVYTHPFRQLNTNEYLSFQDKYVNKYNQEPNLDSVNGYMAINLFANLRKDCGTDAKCYVEKINSGKKYEGILGDVEFADYMRVGDIFLKTISNGKFIPLSR